MGKSPCIGCLERASDGAGTPIRDGEEVDPGTTAATTVPTLLG